MRWLNDEWNEERARAFLPVITERKGRIATRNRFEQISTEVKSWALETVVNNRVPLIAAQAWILPVLSLEACDYLVEETQWLDWQPNEEEEHDYQIPEIVLSEQAPMLDQQVKDALFAGLAPWIATIYGRLPTRYASVQMTRYQPENTSKGHYHIDQDADYTAVVALNDDFVGGGTAFCDGLLGEFEVPPVPKGYALVFGGRTTLHKGLPVLEGTRRLLTVWANNDGDLY